MADATPDPPSDPYGIKGRRETRDEVLRWLTFLFGLIPAVTAALGFSPLTNIWSLLALVVAFALVLASVWSHHRGTNLLKLVSTADVAGTGALPRTLPRRQKLLQRAAVIALIFGAGAWVGSSGRNTYLLATYGTLGDLAIGPGQGFAEPAVISLRKDDRSDTCFYSTATFNIRNATSKDVMIGVVSNDLALSDNGIAPILSRRNMADITRSYAGVSGAVLITGSADEWRKNVETLKAHLTTLRRGESKNVTVFQNRDDAAWGNTCLPDAQGKIPESYKGSAVRISGTIVMVMPDESWRIEGFEVSEPARVEK